MNWMLVVFVMKLIELDRSDDDDDDYDHDHDHDHDKSPVMDKRTRQQNVETEMTARDAG